MARFIPEYKELDTRETWEKVAMVIAWVLLLLLLPGTALGYFAEQSLPGQTLYPVKRGIEAVVLAVESISPYARTNYLQSLTATRIQETNALVQEAATSGNYSNIAINSDNSFGSIVFSIQETVTSIQKIQNPQEKKIAAQKLAESIQQYQVQLQQMHYVLVPHTPDSGPTPTVAANQTTTDTLTSTSSAQDTASATDIQNQITQTQNELQSITNTLQTDTGVQVILPSPTPTLTPSPTPNRGEPHREKRNEDNRN